MSDALLKKLFGNMSYGRVRDLKVYGLTLFIFSVIGCNLPFDTVTASVIFEKLISISTWLGSYAFLDFLVTVKPADFSKDFNSLESDYNKFLESYAELMKDLDINDLNRLCYAFYYLYQNGYLSVDHQYNAENKDFLESRRFGMISLFNGTSVCRHLSVSLKNILNLYGYNASLLTVYSRLSEVLTEEDLNIMRESLKKDLEVHRKGKNVTDIDELYVNFLLSFAKVSSQMINYQVNNDKKSRKELSIKKHFGDHAIVLASDAGKSFSYDPTSNIAYQVIPESNILRNVIGLGYEFRNDKNILHLHNTPSEYKYIAQNFKLPASDISETDIQSTELIAYLDECKKLIEEWWEKNRPLMAGMLEKSIQLRNSGILR